MSQGLHWFFIARQRIGAANRHSPEGKSPIDTNATGHDGSHAHSKRINHHQSSAAEITLVVCLNHCVCCQHATTRQAGLNGVPSGAKARLILQALRTG
jgi:hypothetical protein